MSTPPLGADEHTWATQAFLDVVNGDDRWVERVAVESKSFDAAVYAVKIFATERSRKLAGLHKPGLSITAFPTGLKVYIDGRRGRISWEDITRAALERGRDLPIQRSLMEGSAL